MADQFGFDLFRSQGTDIFKPTGRPKAKSYYQLPTHEKPLAVLEAEREAGLLPQTEQEKRDLRHPALTALTVVGGALNIPSAMISGIAEQLADNVPGFSAREYFRRVFNLQDQVSWYNVLKLLDNKQLNKTSPEWLLVVGGLTLDIILDPLNYVGMGLAKGAFNADDAIKTARQAQYTIAEELLKTGKESSTRYLNSVFNKAYKEAIGRRFGIQIPFTGKVIAPFKSVAPEVTKLVDMGQVTSEAFKALAQRPTVASKLRLGIDKIPGLNKLFDFGEKAFNPFAHGLKDVVEAGGQYKTQIIQAQTDLSVTLHKMTKLEGVTPKIQQLMKNYLENVDDMLYKNSDMIQGMAHKSKLLNDMVRHAVEAGETAGLQQFFTELVHINKAYRKLFKEDVVKALKDFGRTTWEKTGTSAERIAKLTEDVVKATESTWSLSSIHKLQSTLVDLGYTYNEKLVAMAGGEAAVWATKRLFSKSSDEVLELLDGFSDDALAAIDSLADQARGMLDFFHDTELRAGIPSGYIQDYMARYLPGKKEVTAPLAIGPEKQFFQYARTSKNTKELLERIANDMVKSGYVPVKQTAGQTYEIAREYAMESAKKLLSKGDEKFGHVLTTVTESLYMRGVAHHKAMARHSMMKEVAKYGHKWGGTTPPVGFKVAKDSIKELKGLIFDEDTADYIFRVVDTVSSQKQIDQFLKLIDKPLNWWKVMATSVNPGFHFRNFYSNHFLGWIWLGAAYFDPRTHKQALHMTAKAFGSADYRQYKAIGGAFTNVKMSKKFAHGKTFQDAFDFLWDKGAFRRQFRLRDVDPSEAVLSVGAKRMRKRLNILGKESYLAKGGEWLGSVIESEARVAGFLTEFKRIGSMEMAWRKTQEVFINYQMLTPFERTVAKRIVPFWTWLKNNMVNQVKFIFTQPGRYGKIAKVKAALENAVDLKIPEHLQPAYFHDLGMWQMPITLPDGRPLFFNPNFPFQDLNRIKIDPANPRRAASEMVREIATSINPFMQLPITLIPEKGYDIFRAQHLEKFPGHKVPVPGILQPMVKWMVPLFPKTAERLGMEYDGTTVRMDPKAAKAMEALVPAINNYAKFLVADPGPERVDDILNLLSYTAGIKFKPLDVQKQKYYYYVGLIKKRKAEL